MPSDVKEFAAPGEPARTVHAEKSERTRTELTPKFYPEDILGMVIVALVPRFTRLPGDERNAAQWFGAVLDD